jgi:hypothetical protein
MYIYTYICDENDLPGALSLHFKDFSHIYKYVYIYMYIYIHTYIHICICICKHIYINMYA